jgi:tetratricopeptide (TPR) repeat protein
MTSAPATVAQSPEDLLKAASAKVERGENDAAIADLDRALTQRPDYAEALAIRGRAKRNKRDYAGAIVDLDKSIALKPSEADPYYQRGMAKVSRGTTTGLSASSPTTPQHSSSKVAQCLPIVSRAPSG